MRIGIIGGGTVGRATARVYLEHHEVQVNDTVPERRTHPLSSLFNTCDLIFVCIPEDNLDALFGDAIPSVMNYDHHWNSRCLVIKSTVPVGTTARLSRQYRLANLVHSPEFLTERCATTDALLPASLIIGEPCAAGYSTSNLYSECGTLLLSLYQQRFPGVPIITTTSATSEYIKLAVNAFYASKVSLLNELRRGAISLGLDWTPVLHGMLSQGRIAHSHTSVPGPDGRPGFGGKCLPKDLNHLIQCLTISGIPCPILQSVRDRNQIDRNP